MKKIFNVLFLSIFLASCASTVTPVPTVTVTSQAIRTFTPTPTEIPVTPTTTPDPNAPKGTLGKDAQGLYIEANGVKNRQIEITDPISGEVTTIWAFSLNVREKAFPVFDFIEGASLKDQMLLDVMVDSSVSGSEAAKFTHLPNLYNDSAHNTFHSNIIYPFYVRASIDRAHIKQGTNPAIEMKKGITLEFTTSAGTFSWLAVTENPVPNALTIIRNMEDLPIIEGNGVKEYTDPYTSDHSFTLRVKTYVHDGKLISEVASNLPLDELNPRQISMLMLYGVISVVDGPDLDTESHISEVNHFAVLAADAEFPIFDFR